MTDSGRIVGFIEAISDRGIAGWAFRAGDAAPLRLALRIDGGAAVEVVCDRAREDVWALRTDLHAECRHGPMLGFLAEIPAECFDGQAHGFVLETADGAPAGLKTAGLKTVGLKTGGRDADWRPDVAGFLGCAAECGFRFDPTAPMLAEAPAGLASEVMPEAGVVVEDDPDDGGLAFTGLPRAAVARLGIDVLAVLNPGPVAFSATALAGFAAGAEVVALADGGHAAAEVLARGRGIVAADEAALVGLFESLRLVAYVRRRAGEEVSAGELVAGAGVAEIAGGGA